MSTSSGIKAQETTPDVGPDRLRVDCYDGKYTVIQESDGGLHALRYGMHWRNCDGDGLILGLAQDLQDARTRAAVAETEVERLREARKVDALRAATIELNGLLDRYWMGDNSKSNIIAMCAAQQKCKVALA